MKASVRGLFAAIAGVWGLAAAGSASADNIYMHVPGLTGTVTAAGYVGDIAVLSYSQGFSNTGSGSTAGTVLCSEISIQKNIDITSEYFTRNVLEQLGPFNATIYFVNSSNVADTTIELGTVYVRSVSHGAATGGGGISESISMQSTSMTVIFNSGTQKNNYSVTCS
jgi:type VI protein secretion system component Hcp